MLTCKGKDWSKHFPNMIEIIETYLAGIPIVLRPVERGGLKLARGVFTIWMSM